MYIGLDIGTSGTKAALVNSSGETLSYYQVNYSFSNNKNGYRELDGNEIWAAVKTCLKIVSQAGIASTITVSSLGEAFVPINRQGIPLYACITGTDIRGNDEIKEIVEKIGRDRLIKITGVSPSSMYSAPKIFWLEKNYSDVCSHVWKFLTIQDFIIFKLTGHAIVDYSVASRTMLFDTNTYSWSKEICDVIGIKQEQLASPVISGTIVSNVTSEVEKECKLPRNLKVIVGAHDHIANAIGSGSCQPGDCSNAAGTTEGITAILKASDLSNENISKYKISREPFISKQIFNTVAWSNTSGVLLKWFAQEFNIFNNKSLLDVYKELNKNLPEKPTKVLVLPLFSGAGTPYDDNCSKGAIIGLDLSTKPIEIYKALMEGINYELALIIETLKEAGISFKKIVSTGGSLSEPLLQIKSDVLGEPIYTVHNHQTGTLGGAIIAACSIKDYDSISEAVSQMVKYDKIYYPINKNKNFYYNQFQIFKKIYPALREINNDLTENQFFYDEN